MGYQKYKEIKAKYSGYASWAVWDYKNAADTSIIENSIADLNSKQVFLALNISEPLKNKPWCNFHGGKHDRKIKYASNNTKLRGSYITDLFKGIVEAKSNNFWSKLDQKLINDNVEFFKTEMIDLSITNKTRFILFGKENSTIANMFNKHFKPYFKNQVIYYYHYAYYGVTDKDWVEGLWSKLGIKANFEKEQAKYK